MPEELLVRETARALAVDTSMVQDVFSSLLEQDLLRTEEMGGIRLIYPEYLYTAEVQTARRLLKLRDQAKPVTRVNADEVIAKWERDAGITLAEAQRQAIYASLEHGVFVLTGGPGTGKTTVVKGILNVLEQAGCRILLAALPDAPHADWRILPVILQQRYIVCWNISLRVTACASARMTAILLMRKRLLSMRLRCSISA